jgi:hypothetical protein
MSPPPAAPPPTSPSTLEGPVHAVPCPWCGHKNDLRPIQSQIDQAFEPGCVYDCDRCKKLIVVTRGAPITIVQVRQKR